MYALEVQREESLEGSDVLEEVESLEKALCIFDNVQLFCTQLILQLTQPQAPLCLLDSKSPATQAHPLAQGQLRKATI